MAGAELDTRVSGSGGGKTSGACQAAPGGAR